MTADRRQLLVLGPPRSGTTLLAAMLGCHSGIAMLFEERTGAARRLIGPRMAGNKLCVPNQIRAERSRALGARLVRRARFMAGLPLTDWAVADYAGWAETSFVLIAREGPATVRSMVRRGGLTPPAAAARWADGLAELEAVREAYPDRTSVVTFADLVGRPEATIRAVLDALGLPFEPAVLDGPRHTPIYEGRTAVDASRSAPVEADVALPAAAEARFARLRAARLPLAEGGS